MTDVVARWRLEDFHELTLYSQRLDIAQADWRNGFTLCFWFQAQDLSRTQVIVHGDDLAKRWEIYIHDGALVISTQMSLRDKNASIPLRDTNWHHAALVYDTAAGEFRAYLDGTAPIILPLIPLIESPRMDVLHVGGYTDPAGGHFDYTFGRGGRGLIDDLRIYNRALSSAEIARFVTPNSAPPQAQFSVDLAGGEAPLDAEFDASDSRAQKGDIRAYLWDFGDGTRGYGEVVTHRYAYAGQYTARLTVVDDSHEQSIIEQQIMLGGRENPLRFVPVFASGTEGYACYRIPAVVRAANGDLLAFAEGRVEGCSDSTSSIHIVCKRSSDNGETWSPLSVVAAVEGYVAMNPSPVVDEVRGTGRIVVAFRAASASEWDVARGDGINRAMIVTSDDGGITWSAPRDITAFVHKPYQPRFADVCPAAVLPENRAEDWRIQIPGAGHAIQLRRIAETRGRLFFAGSITRGERSVFDSENYAFWSDDLGETWQIGGIIPRVGLNEAMAVELDDGRVMFNTRAYTDQKPDGRRAVTIGTFDAGSAIHFGETDHDETLIDPAVQASILRYSWRDPSVPDSRNRILFANPAHPRARVNLTVRLSEDEGQTWAYSKTVDAGASAYSDLVVTHDNQIGLLYERGNTGGLWFVRFPPSWLMED